MRAVQDFTDVEWETVQRLSDALEGADARGLTPSQAARKAGTDTVTAARVLAWLVGERYAHVSGNGAWKHFHAGRA